MHIIFVLCCIISHVLHQLPGSVLHCWTVTVQSLSSPQSLFCSLQSVSPYHIIFVSTCSTKSVIINIVSMNGPIKLRNNKHCISDL